MLSTRPEAHVYTSSEEPTLSFRVLMDSHSGLRGLGSAGQVEQRPSTSWGMTPGRVATPFRLFQPNSTQTCEATGWILHWFLT